MSADVNYDVKTGRLVKDAESKSFDKSFLISGCIAVNRSYKKGDQYVEEASFFNFKTWVKSEKQRDFYLKHFKKGAQVTIDGEMVQERWEKDGQKQSMYVIYANRIVPAWGVSDSGSSNSGSDSSGVPSFSNNEGFPEDIPF